MARFELSGTVTVDDHAAFVGTLVQRQINQKYGNAAVLMNPWVTWLAFAICFALSGHRIWELKSGWLEYGQLYLWSGDAILFGLFVWVCVSLLRSRGNVAKSLQARVGKQASIEGINVGPVEIVADEDALMVRHAKRKTTYRWAAFQELVRTRETLALKTGPLSAVLVPIVAFGGDDKLRAFEDFADQQIKAAAGA